MAKRKPWKIKYAVCPGYVISKNDSDRHYIDSRQLIILYGVDPKECRIFNGGYVQTRIPENLIILRPRYDGNYGGNHAK